MNKLFRVLILIIAMFAYTNASDIVGATKGEFSVNQGSASYDLEIVTPKGVAGLKPKLSINYNSANSFNGVLGVGFSLNGLSQISKCNQKLFSDKKNSSRNYNYCLNGQTLVLKDTTKAYGSNTEYKTEIDSYAKIEKTSSGWQVYKKDGLLYEYGYTSDSKDSNSFYRLNKISDRFNNQINFTYNTTIKKIKKITYANNEIDFIYENRNDKKSLYSRGIKFDYSKRLQKVLIKTDSKEVTSYVINYDYQNSKSKIIDIKECINQQCLDPILFTWEKSSIQGSYKKKEYNVKNRYSPDMYTRTRYMFKEGDFNGDGLTDLIRYLPNKYARMMISNGDGTFNELNNDLKYLSSSRTGDFNGDGLTDLIKVDDRNITVWLCKSNGTFTTKRTNSKINSFMSIPIYLFGDFNGNGLTDVYVFINSSYGYFFFSKGDGFFNVKKINYSTTIRNQLLGGYDKLKVNSSKIGDFNGDGLTDVFLNNNTILFSKGNGSFSVKRYDFKVVKIRGGSVKTKVGDFNGDGLTDILSTSVDHEGDTYAVVYFSKGNGSFEKGKTFRVSSGRLLSSYTKAIDFNNDGLSDIAMGNKELMENKLIIWISKGDGTFSYYGMSYDNYIGTFDIDGNGSLDLVLPRGKQKIKLWLNKNKKLPVKNITNTKNENITINYSSLRDEETYQYDETLQENISFPNRILKASSMKVVKNFTSLNGIGDNVNKTSFFYKDFKINYERGGLGFKQIEITDEAQELKTIFTNNQDYPLTGLVDKKEIIKTTNNQTISIIDNEYDKKTTGDYTQVYLSKSTEENFDLDGSELTKKVTLNEDINEFGQVGLSTTNITNLDDTNDKEYKTIVDSTYETKAINTNGFITEESLLEKRITKAYLDSSLTNTNTTQYKYNTNGTIKNEIIEPTNPKALTKSYEYYPNGNLYKEKLSGTSIARTVEYSYDNANINISQIKNSLGHTEKRTYNARNQLITTMDSNDLTTTIEYDTIGRKIKETNPDTTYLKWTYTWANGQLKIKETLNNQFPQTTTYDRLAREIKKEKIGFDGTTIYEEFFYDEKGNKDYTYMPYFDGQTPQKIDYTYDSLNRLIKTKTPASHDRIAVETVDYDGLKNITTNAKGQRKRTTVNALGKVILVEDNIDGSENETSKIIYEYDALGNLTKTTDSKNNEIIIQYDNFGNKIKQIDPDMGTWTYTYYPTGELHTQTDAKNQTTTFTYDELGRVTKKITPEGNITFVYDTAVGEGKGKIHKEIGIVVSKEYQYNNYGQLFKIITIIDNKRYEKKYVYDDLGRVSKTIEPNSVEIKNYYNINGYLEAITTPEKYQGDGKADSPDYLKEEMYHAINEYKKNKKLYIEYKYKLAKYKTSYNNIHQILELYKGTYNGHAPGTMARLTDYVSSLESLIEVFETLVYAYDPYEEELKMSRLLYKIERSNNLELESVYNYFKNSLYELAEYAAALTGQLQRLDIIYTARNDEIIEFYEKVLTSSNSDLEDDINDIEELKNRVEFHKTKMEAYENKSSAYSELLNSDEIYFYKVLEQDSFGNVTSYLSGNGLETKREYDNRYLRSIITGYDSDSSNIREKFFEYDILGNVTYRRDQVIGTEQSYIYDSLNRLKYANINNIGNSKNLEFKYDSIGNITSKVVNESSIPSQKFNYHYDTNKPHAVSSLSLRTYGEERVMKSFDYDANGNMFKKRGKAIEYTSFNKPSKINYESGGAQLFYYDANNKRYKTTIWGTNKHYLNDTYEITYKSNGGVQEERYFIYVDGQLISSFLFEEDGRPIIEYFYYDNLGSIDAISNNYNPTNLQRIAYEPFGERKDLDNWGKEIGYIPQYKTNRGYTGHEHLSDGLIHMNGRVYDPTIGRFVSVDPNIPHVYDTQSYSRYSYARNNPLKYVDPSGYIDSYSSPNGVDEDSDNFAGNNGDGEDSGGDWYSELVEAAKEHYFGNVRSTFGLEAEMNARTAAGAFKAGMTFGDYSSLMWNASRNANYISELGTITSTYFNFTSYVTMYDLLVASSLDAIERVKNKKL